ncbi:MAG: gamma-glutamyl-gamma-aminobutyrate hydrolase family protein [Candidatus Aenigmarchaeota archaeon]|nr:gamma-glutamyl-gamma-aminobutyrate hydrolase family protein [Candidatus Aenigmarchaeota archaeon]
MLLIVNNGKGAEEISGFLRMQNKIVKPSEAGSVKASAYILSDGSLSHQKDNEKIIKSSAKPVLGIGAGSLFVAAAFGGKIKKTAKTERQERVMVEKPSPLTLDMKRNFTVFESYENVIEELPESFEPMARSAKYDFEIILHVENPLFGVQFNPEKGGDGRMILANFEKFIGVWEKYHK